MRELLSVEYMSFTGNPKQKDQRLALDGCLGEVDKRSYVRALRAFRAAIKAGTPATQTVSVRFPLNMPMTHVGFYPNWGFASDDIDEQGIAIPVQNLRVSKKPLISSYSRAPWPEDTRDMLKAFEAPLYFETFSRARLLGAIERMHTILPYGWIWCGESQMTDRPLLFQGARIYGADNLIQVYANAGRFKGLAVQVFTRDLLHGYHNKMASDILLLTNTTEYVEYLDGETIPRNRVPSPVRYFREYLDSSRVLTAKNILPLLRKQNQIKAKEKPEAKPVKPSGPPGYKFDIPDKYPAEWATLTNTNGGITGNTGLTGNGNFTASYSGNTIYKRNA